MRPTNSKMGLETEASNATHRKRVKRKKVFRMAEKKSRKKSAATQKRMFEHLAQKVSWAIVFPHQISKDSDSHKNMLNAWQWSF